MIYDLHTHTKYSPRCGVIEPGELVKTAISKGLDGIAVTDHDTIKGGIMASKFETSDFIVIIGSEITTTDGELIGLFLQEEIRSRSPFEVIDEIHDQGGLVVVPHPFDRFRSKRFKNLDEYVRKVDAIEVFNSRCISNRSNRLARDFAINHGRKHKLAMVGGSDAHYPSEIGLGYTRVPDDCVKDDARERVRYALKNAMTDGMGSRSPLTAHVRTKLHKWCKNGIVH